MDRDASRLLLDDAGDAPFAFLGEGSRGIIRDFRPGRDRINLAPLGLTPDDLLISTDGRDLVLSFDGGEVALIGAAGLTLEERDFRF